MLEFAQSYRRVEEMLQQMISSRQQYPASSMKPQITISQAGTMVDSGQSLVEVNEAGNIDLETNPITGSMVNLKWAPIEIKVEESEDIRKNEAHLFDKIPEEEETEASNEVQVFVKITEREETEESNGGEVGVSIVEWESIYELICNDYESHLVHINGGAEVIGYEDEEYSENKEDQVLDEMTERYANAFLDLSPQYNFIDNDNLGDEAPSRIVDNVFDKCPQRARETFEEFSIHLHDLRNGSSVFNKNFKLDSELFGNIKLTLGDSGKFLIENDGKERTIECLCWDVPGDAFGEPRQVDKIIPRTLPTYATGAIILVVNKMGGDEEFTATRNNVSRVLPLQEVPNLSQSSGAKVVSKAGFMSLLQVDDMVLVLLGIMPLAALSATSLSKLDKVLVSNPLERLFSISMLEVVDVVYSGKELCDFASRLHGSCVIGELTSSFESEADLFHSTKKADMGFVTGLVSFFCNFQRAVEMHQDFSEGLLHLAELFTRRFDGLKALKVCFGVEGSLVGVTLSTSSVGMKMTFLMGRNGANTFYGQKCMHGCMVVLLLVVLVTFLHMLLVLRHICVPWYLRLMIGLNVDLLPKRGDRHNDKRQIIATVKWHDGSLRAALDTAILEETIVSKIAEDLIQSRSVANIDIDVNNSDSAPILIATLLALNARETNGVIGRSLNSITKFGKNLFICGDHLFAGILFSYENENDWLTTMRAFKSLTPEHIDEILGSRLLVLGVEGGCHGCFNSAGMDHYTDILWHFTASLSVTDLVQLLLVLCLQILLFLVIKITPKGGITFLPCLAELLPILDIQWVNTLMLGSGSITILEVIGLIHLRSGWLVILLEAANSDVIQAPNGILQSIVTCLKDVNDNLGNKMENNYGHKKVTGTTKHQVTLFADFFEVEGNYKSQTLRTRFISRGKECSKCYYQLSK